MEYHQLKKEIHELNDLNILNISSNKNYNKLHEKNKTLNRNLNELKNGYNKILSL